MVVGPLDECSGALFGLKSPLSDSSMLDWTIFELPCRDVKEC